jgi:hypothetical protein
MITFFAVSMATCLTMVIVGCIRLTRAIRTLKVPGETDNGDR